MNAPKLLTMEEAAHTLGICKRSLERLIARGEFPAPLRLGRAVRVPASWIDEYIKKLSEGVAA
jgi:excisionase family DNA binding protein